MKYVKIYERFFGQEASGLLAYCKENGKFLIGKRSEWVNEPHTWSTFGGAIGLDYFHREEEKLPPKENAIKEFEEETGFSGTIKLYPMYIFESDNFKYYNYLGIFEKEFEPKSLDHENEEFIYISPDDLFSNSHDLDYHFGLEGLLQNSKNDIKKIIYNL